jgi:hypothetical protein
MTNNLPYDKARCHGIDRAPICSDCRRKEPGDPVRQVYVYPPVCWRDCEFYIGPVECGDLIESVDVESEK